MTRAALAPVAFGTFAFALYVASLPPSYAFWDTGELQTVAAILGIAHPPACPAFVLLGWAFVHLVPLGEAAWRVGLMCAASVAAAVGLLYATARRLGISRWPAAIVTLGFATASVVWRDATRAEVHDLALLLRVLALVFAFRYAACGRIRDLFFTALALGLAGATHGIALLVLPALALALARRYRELRGRAALAAACGLALGLAPYAYLPLRSMWLYAHHVDPTLALGLPPGAPFWDYDHPATVRNFVRVITGADFDVHSGFAGFAAVARYPQFAAALLTRLGEAFGIAGAIVAAIGAGRMALSRSPERIALLVAAVLTVPYTETYTALQDPDRYYLLALWCGALALGIGFDTLARLVALESKTIGRYALLAALVASLVAAAPGRLSIFAQRDDYAARDYARDIVALVPDGSIVLAEWAYSTPLAYAAYVDGTFGRRVVLAASPTQYLQYVPTWLTTRGVYVVSFDAHLALPGFTVVPLKSSFYYVYLIAAVTRPS
ncbi:MAG: hypothetical protein NVSMB19_07030 [Vulcanimicrobiaceae bacterium]